MKIALFPNKAIEQSFEFAKTIQEFLKTHHHDTLICKDFMCDENQLKDSDYLLTLGGDGTILKLKHHYPDLNIPILGVNVGHLGFMADIQTSELKTSLLEFINKKFTIEERIMLEAAHPRFNSEFACNDIVVHRGVHPSIIQLAIHVDGSYFNTFEADGIIISTPNGSTAYSLAAGGPILSPELNAIVITPICPHTISNRPIVISADHEIRIEYLTPYDTVEIRFDGSWMLPLSPKESFTIKKSNKKFQLVKLESADYFMTLRNKLNWQGRLRY